MKNLPSLPALLLLLVAIPVHATTVIAPDFDSMVRRSELIFTGRVTAQRCEWRRDGGRPSIVTVVTFDVDKVHKGRAGAGLQLEFLGGTIGEVTMDVSSSPKFKNDERLVLFVETRRGNASPLVGFHHGRFNIERDVLSGREMMTRHDGAPLASVAEIGRAVPRRGAPAAAMTHAEFVGKVVETARKGN
jgi:hypothetical protein